MTEASTLSEDRVADTPALPCRNHGLLVFAVIAVTVMQLLDVTIANVALPHMRASLGATMDTIGWILTSFIVAGVMVTPIVGWCTDRLGSRNVFLAAFAGFIVSSMLCGAATTLPQMVLFRAIQGACAGFMSPMTQTILFDVTRPSRQGNVMSVFGTTIMVAPLAGPMLGGYLTENLDWRWIFYVNVPIGIPVFTLLFWLLPSRPRVARKLDRVGFALLMLGLVALQLMLDRGEHKDWFSSWEIIIELGIAISAFWVYFFHTRTTRNPLFPSRLFADSNFMVSMGVMMILGLGNVALAAVIPTMYQRIYGYSPFDTGLLIMPRAIGLMLMMMLVNHIMRAVDIRYLLMAGYMIASSALFFMSGWSISMNAWDLMWPGFIQGLGLGLVFTPINIAAYSTISLQNRPDASSLLNLMRNMGSSLGISVIFTLISRNTQISHSDLATHVTSFNLPSIDPVMTADRFGDIGSAIMMMIDGELNRQALMIAYLDNFYMVAMLLFMIGLLPLLLKPIRL